MLGEEARHKYVSFHLYKMSESANSQRQERD